VRRDDTLVGIHRRGSLLLLHRRCPERMPPAARSSRATPAFCRSGDRLQVGRDLRASRSEPRPARARLALEHTVPHILQQAILTASFLFVKGLILLQASGRAARRGREGREGRGRPAGGLTERQKARGGGGKTPGGGGAAFVRAAGD